MLSGITAERAKEEDLPEILRLQKLAYRSEAEICGDYDIPPLTQTFAGIREDYESQIMLKIVYEGRIIGSVRAYEKEQVCHIGRVIVHPDYQNRGIGKILMRFIENHFSRCAAYSLFTGKDSARNLHFYRKLGYSEKGEQIINDKLTFIYLEKENACQSR